MLSLSGRVALVTGGSRGIGAGIARLFAQAGAHVVINFSRSREDAARVTAAIVADGGRAEAAQADVSDRQAVRAMIEAIVDRHGRLDVLVNNAGVAIDLPLSELTDAAWDRVIDVNLRGTFLCSQLAAPVMLAQRQGKIINVSAATAIRGRKNGANYCAAKAGVIALTKCLALELAPDIQVNCLLPGFTETADVIERFGLSDPERRRQLTQTIPLGRLAVTSDIARGALFLASDLSNYVTGQTLCVNGGSFM
ncbi:MAG TPA: 3-oxoacyl-ACP reductase family protein [Limnochordia bacterium]